MAAQSIKTARHETEAKPATTVSTTLAWRTERMALIRKNAETVLRLERDISQTTK
jgi:hypothetical protein